MKINIIGAGPAGLYFAILMKKIDPAHDVTIVERDGPNDTFGWGIVFSDKTFAFLKDSDETSYLDITAAAESWDNVDVVHRDQRISVRGNEFLGIARITFLNILHKYCRNLGVDLRFHTNVTTPGRIAELADCDLLVGGDGANSLVRQNYSGFFCPSVDVRRNKYIWLGTRQLFHGLTMIFREADAGLFIAHAYKFDKTTSTFIVECPPETWLKARFEHMPEDETCAYLAEVFKSDLGGHPLLSNNFVRWLNFPLVKNKRWFHKNIVLLGDALHTAHFSIGSGTKLALEDAIALAGCFAGHREESSNSKSQTSKGSGQALLSPRPSPLLGASGVGSRRRVEAALAEFERVRMPVVEKFQDAALNSLTWLEDVQEHLHLEPVPFTYRLMTRSRRISYNRIKRGDPEFIARYDAWRAQQPSAGPIPAEFLDLFQKKTFAHLATLMADGTPHVTSVYVDYDGQHILINSARGRQKDINMEKRRHVAIEVPDPDNPNRFLAVRGPIVEITEQGADEHLDRLAQRYLNRDKYPDSMRFPGEVRCIYKILPKHVTVWDPFGR
ncbi:MAG TPA: TIGR03618 family F420-dependent PPOX class oxidoreductase [Anaerolineae bacterium]|nr:TIGR03618 family F420-dependent PPOX class oxidoreductase [Anaerolineae bacterium]